VAIVVQMIVCVVSTTKMNTNNRPASSWSV
jgi:hypothetical protein